MSIGKKDDGGKLRWGLLRKSLVLPLEAVIRVLSFGADKYGNENWKEVENAQVRYRDALDRHLAALDKGELVDSDTGESHYAHVATNALFLLHFHQPQDKLETVKESINPWRMHCPGDPQPTQNYVEVQLENGITTRAQADRILWDLQPGPGSRVRCWRYVL